MQLCHFIRNLKFTSFCSWKLLIFLVLKGRLKWFVLYTTAWMVWRQALIMGIYGLDAVAGHWIILKGLEYLLNVVWLVYEGKCPSYSYLRTYRHIYRSQQICTDILIIMNDCVSRFNSSYLLTAQVCWACTEIYYMYTEKYSIHRHIILWLI